MKGVWFGWCDLPVQARRLNTAVRDGKTVTYVDILAEVIQSKSEKNLDRLYWHLMDRRYNGKEYRKFVGWVDEDDYTVFTQTK
jgi:hypothetical protein